MPAGTVTLAVLADRIANLSADVCSAVDGIKDVVTGFTKFQIDYERRHADVVTELNVQKASMQTVKDELTSLTGVVTAQAKEIENLKESVKELKSITGRVLKWWGRLFWALFIPFLLGLVSFIIGLLTHTIVLSFPK